MPRIYLKPNSAEFDDSGRKPAERHCEMPGCREQGAHKAPKSRDLKEYYWFCLDHVKEYNKAWNYFEGMTGEQVEDQIINSFYGDRPTRRYDQHLFSFESLYRKSWQTYQFDEEPPQDRKSSPFGGDRNSAEYEALMIMGLEAPVTLDVIKTRYKKLAKKYHPDLNRGDKECEELLKGVNMAYTILKLAYQKFEDLPSEA
ncbi:MAG: J domain-containing protein [Alphaproteobacteria bacterium]